jgi:hypothetical protein
LDPDLDTPNPDKPEPKTFKDLPQRHKGHQGTPRNIFLFSATNLQFHLADNPGLFNRKPKTENRKRYNSGVVLKMLTITIHTYMVIWRRGPERR